MRYKICFLPTMAGLLLSHSLLAAPETSAPIVVTATRTAQIVDESLAPIVIITRQEIAQSQATDVADLLRFHAGFDISRNGGPGQASSLFLRGTDSNHTLVMIDGVKINPGTIGGAALQNISPDIIERIEIVKGPRSTLYGSEAIGGVINIITRSKDEGPTAQARYRSGKYNSRNYLFALKQKDGDFRTGLSANFYETDGFPTRTASSVNSGYDNTTINAYIGTRVGPVDVEASFWDASGNSEYLDFFLTPLDQDYENSAGSVSLKASPLDRWATTLKLSHITDKIDQNQSSDFAHTRRDALDWQNDIQIGEIQLLTTGILYTREKVSSIIFGSGFSEDTSVKAAYVQDDITVGKHHLLLADRLTDHDSFNRHNSWNIEYGYRWTPATQLTASAGTAFRAPDNTDRFGFGGNPDLNPETARNLELGLRHRFNRHHSASLQLFDNQIDDLIEFNTLSSHVENIGSASIRGLETSYAFSMRAWNLKLSGTLQDPQNDETHSRLLRRAKRSLATTVSYNRTHYGLALNLLTTSDRKDFGGKLGGYTLVNATAQIRPYKNWLASLKVENLLDEHYQLARTFNTAERSFFLELGYDYP